MSAADKRALIVRDFFRHHGWIANMKENYDHYVSKMAILIDGRVIGPLYTPEQCLSDMLTYEHTLVGHSAQCTIPAMTDGGYFIIKGAEKVLVIQETRLQTEPYTTKDSCELFVDGAIVHTRIYIADDSVIYLDTSMILKDIRGVSSIGIYELIMYIFLCDVESDNERAMLLLNIVYSCCDDDRTSNACMMYIMSSTKGVGNLDVENDRNVIRRKMFANMSDQTIVATLVMMIVRCVSVHLNTSAPTDRDDYAYKCLRTPGNIIYTAFKRCVYAGKNLQSLVEKKIYSAIRRGEFSIGGVVYNKMAVQLSKRSTIDRLSSVRKVLVPCDENSPNIRMRQIHNSQKGYICPCETPEGKTVGITKSLACCCLVSTKTNIRDWLDENCTTTHDPELMWVIVDGAVAGWCPRNVDIPKLRFPTASFRLSKNTLSIRTVGGRPLRPLFVIHKHPIDWNEVGVAPFTFGSDTYRYIDPAEANASTIASIGYAGDWKRFDYMEIHPCTVLGLAASLIPFPEHDQSARNVFSSAMLKQAMQMHDSEKTCDTLQRPLVYTLVGKEVGYDEDPNGLNLVTCIMSINGFNQEDAIIVKKSAAERGMFSSTATFVTSLIVDNPWKTAEVDGKLSIVHGGIERSLVDTMPMLSNPKVHSIKEYPADNGKTKLEITVTEHRTLQLGDKLSSRHAQKGVVGLLMNEHDMPFTRDGIVPDIIINPHAIPSRMTVGQLLEGVLGKAASVTGEFEDGTPFVRKNMKDISDVLKLSDTETVTLGTTGEIVDSPVAIGMVYYMALKHQAADKIYVRSSGPKSLMARQPISGRSKGGGLRFGEMEYDCLIAHGASNLVTEISRNSDMVEAPYCPTCRIVTDIFDKPCEFCKGDIVAKQVPFSYTVFKDLMLSANIAVQSNF